MVRSDEEKRNWFGEEGVDGERNRRYLESCGSPEWFWVRFECCTIFILMQNCEILILDSALIVTPFISNIMDLLLYLVSNQEVLKKVVKLAAEQISLAWGLEEELSKLRKELLKAEALLSDINTRKLHHGSVQMWVDDLQVLVYQADDLLDEIVYEHLRQKVQIGKIKQVRNLVSPSNNAFIFRLKMAKKMKNVLDLLHKHYSAAGPLGLVGNEFVEHEIDFISQFRETTSGLDEYEVVGRDVEVESIVKKLIDASDQQFRSILPIVGMGGLGKTTLAKLVFNHELVKKHFDKTIWVCVSEPFVVNKILGAILQNLTDMSNDLDNRQVLLQKLLKEMHGKRYFLVLDDVWNENTYLWDELKTCLINITGKSDNSSILVTTRSVDVAKIMETLPSHHLSKLSDYQCWSLFKESASANGLSMTSSMDVIRKELVKKIGGIPLVARVLGRAVKFEGDDERWLKTLESIMQTPLQEENLVLSVLKLSVDRLPSSSLKQCFAYCSNFPKDFVFEKDRLVQMWMAQGFIQPQEGRINITTENVGDMYFNILLSRCLFQDIVMDDRGRIMYGKMHDLLHDIACTISSDKKLQLNRTNLVDEELWKEGISRLPVDKKDIMMDEKIINFLPLRVLISGPGTIYKLSNSIGELKHLRYLEIRDNGIIKLPKSIALLYNLQTLKIGTPIVHLPQNLSELVNLRHLEYWTSLKKMPPYLSEMTQLQTLSSFIVGLEKGCNITELGPLNNLKGSLKLYCLDQVKSEDESSKAKLVDKEKLDNIEFFWSIKRKDNSYNDLEVLKGLQPHKNLQSLELFNFAGTCLPNKIFVENLRIVRLHFCKNCETLPMLGNLSNLKELKIYGLGSIRRIGQEFYGNDSNRRAIFPKLEKFTVRYMINLDDWEEVTGSSNVSTFPNLKILEINSCHKLLNIPNLFGFCDENDVEYLKCLKISHCNQLTELPTGLLNCRSIESLWIHHNSNLLINLQNMSTLLHLSIGPLQKLPEGLAHLMKLKKMGISGCIQNYDFSFLMHLSSLTSLCLVDELSSAMTQLPQQLQHLTTLKSLVLEKFCCIEALPEWLGNLVCLNSMRLYDCENLKRLPSKQVMLRLTKLCSLYVGKCPQLQLGEGDKERVKLSHLPDINVEFTHPFYTL